MLPRDPRIPVHLLIAVGTADSSFSTLGFISDLSSTGMFVRSEALRPVGTTLEMVFWDEDGTRQPIRRTGRVARVVRVNGKSGMGIKLDPPDQRTGVALECVIARMRLAAAQKTNLPSTVDFAKYIHNEFGDAIFFHMAACGRCRIEVERIRPRGRNE